ncbi:putative bifunctional diguanylate cyclase/phosphodiesterase [Cryobacterium tepidiphilum]|uniref:EAL domain-containing protein n=1 Tax=Cryobacterium tepidiphilum TaxID=2486026 RepID=A0A3M8L1Q1_9MICO|nr:EAL domain-containing protein [Cryobacterium tepidiphilum]RNE59205.1 EAL domain-containing protein [Cryobacterium tepidiphilum]
MAVSARRLGLWGFAGIGAALIGQALLLLGGSSGMDWAIAVMALICVATLEYNRFPLSRAPHRTPVVSLPVLVLPALAASVPFGTAAGLVALGVLLALVRTRQLVVVLYGAGLAGAGSMVSVGVSLLLGDAGMLHPAASALGTLAYLVFVLAVELLRVGSFRGTSVDAAVDELTMMTGSQVSGGLATISPARLGAVAFAGVVTSALASYASSSGVPLFALGSAAQNSVVVLVLLVLLSVLAQSLIRGVVMRRRLRGLIVGAMRLAETGRHSTPAAIDLNDPNAATPSVIETLYRSVLRSVGVEQVGLRDTPPGVGEIGARIRLSKDVTRFVVARRDPMDKHFSPEDSDLLGALAFTANVVIKDRYNIGGLTARANTDALTGLPNYGAFKEALANINDHREYSEALAVLFIDLDDFKLLNDRYGHDVGDRVLSELGRRLRKVVRNGDVVARVGGDEFVIILTRLVSLAQAKLLAERVMEETSRRLTVGPVTFAPVLSIGLAYSAHRETDVSQLVKDADHSMLAIKKWRRGGGIAEESTINISAHRSSEMNDIVARAIDDEQLELVFQPIVSLVTGQIWAFEALVRYTHPVLGVVSPASLVQKAKDIGKLDDLTRQVAGKAMRAAAEFRLAQASIVCVTVNIDANQLMPDRVGSFIEALVVEYPALSLCLELNERSVSRVSETVRDQAERLRDMGVLVALDDYGSQGSSVDALVRVPMDILKIDRSLADNLADVRQQEILRALQGFGDNLEYSMIVEGVESAETAANLASLGIRSAQGYYFGSPRGLEATLSRLEAFGSAAVVPASVAHETQAEPPVVDDVSTAPIEQQGQNHPLGMQAAEQFALFAAEQRAVAEAALEDSASG